jgi:hypothetical protein
MPMSQFRAFSGKVDTGYPEENATTGEDGKIALATPEMARSEGSNLPKIGGNRVAPFRLYDRCKAFVPMLLVGARIQSWLA